MKIRFRCIENPGFVDNYIVYYSRIFSFDLTKIIPFINTTVYLYRGIGVVVTSPYGCRYNNLTSTYSGFWIGLWMNNKLYLSPLLYEEIFVRIGRFRATVVAKEKGVKSFLYGNDLFASSIQEYYPPLDNPVAVVDASDGRVIGVGELTIDPVLFMRMVRESVEEPVVRNIYDLSVFIKYFK